MINIKKTLINWKKKVVLVFLMKNKLKKLFEIF